MIVDDDVMNIEVLKAMLGSQSVPTDSAMSGPQALSMIKERINNAGAPMYKIMLLDFSMPEMTGPQLTHEIRQLFELKEA